MSAYITTGLSPPAIFITPLGNHPPSGYTAHINDIVDALQYKVVECERTPLANEDHRFGCFALSHACPDAIFEAECARVGRPELGRQARAMPQVPVPPMQAAPFKLLQETHQIGLNRVDAVFDAVKSTWTEDQRFDFAAMRFPTLSAYMQYLSETYGALDDIAVAHIRTLIHAPLDPTKNIVAELATMQRNITLLPVALRGKYTDDEKIQVVLFALRAEEAARVNNEMNSRYPVKHTRTWPQFVVICQQQVTLYRNEHPIIAGALVAAAGGGKKGGHVADEKKFCFGHNVTSHSGVGCTGLAKYVEDHGAHLTFLHKIKTNRDIKVKGKDVTLKAGFLYADRDKKKAAAPAAAQRARRAPAAAASVDGDTADHDDLSTIGSGWNTADGSDV
jgi:hypothetical protein